MLCRQCGNDNPEIGYFCHQCGLRLNSEKSNLPTQNNVTRYNGLDALRGMAMLLGIVLHAALPYMPDIGSFWPADENSSYVVTTIFHFIHVWRMPLFFILVGFFANLVVSTKSWQSWWGNRLLRIGLPIVVFSPLMSLTLPWIFKYGRTGEFTFFYTSEGQPFHLWFLWHLIILVIFTAVFRTSYLGGIRVVNSLQRIGLGFIGSIFRRAKAALAGILFRPRFPMVFILLCSVINLPTQGELILNPIASGLYFVIGFSLYGNASLFKFLKKQWRYYFLAGLVGFTVFMMLESKNGESLSLFGLRAISEPFALVSVFLNILCAVLFSYAFIGLVEKRFGSYNAGLRFISDGAYWMYLTHLPVVTFATFFMFESSMPVEIKFLLAILVTSTVCLGTYKYFVRSTPIGLMLNGRRYPFKAFGL